MCQLLEKAREKQGGISYYEVAKRLKVSDQLMNRWKNDKSKPNGINTLKLAEMAGIEIKEAIKIVQGGFINAGLTITIAGISSLYFLIITQSAWKPLLASLSNSIHCILCKMGHLKKIRV